MELILPMKKEARSCRLWIAYALWPPHLSRLAGVEDVGQEINSGILIRIGGRFSMEGINRCLSLSLSLSLSLFYEISFSLLPIPGRMSDGHWLDDFHLSTSVNRVAVLVASAAPRDNIKQSVYCVPRVVYVDDARVTDYIQIHYL